MPPPSVRVHRASAVLAFIVSMAVGQASCRQKTEPSGEPRGTTTEEAGDEIRHRVADRSVIVRRFPTGLFRSNCYVVSIGTEGFIVDAGSNDEAIRRYVEQRHLKIRYIFVTHSHVDHLAYGSLVKTWTGGALAVHEADLGHFAYYTPERIEQLIGGGMMSRSDLPTLRRYLKTKPDALLRAGEHFDLQGVDIEILHTPGHSAGSVCVRLGAKLLFTGDTLFAKGIGRTDLDSGDHAQIVQSLREVLFVLPDDVVLYPGHGPSSPLNEARANATAFL